MPKERLTYNRVCPVCGTAFVAYRKDKLYDTPTCRMQASRDAIRIRQEDEKRRLEEEDKKDLGKALSRAMPSFMKQIAPQFGFDEIPDLKFEVVEQNDNSVRVVVTDGDDVSITMSMKIEDITARDANGQIVHVSTE